jgi:hypothetical protein
MAGLTNDHDVLKSRAEDWDRLRCCADISEAVVIANPVDESLPAAGLSRMAPTA